MKARVVWLENMRFVAQSQSGHSVVMDAAPEVGGDNLGPRPMEMLLMGMGGCTAIDVMHILRKARQQVQDCAIELEAQRADADPKVFTTIHVHFIITGTKVSAQHVERAVKLSAEKYCSASIMLGQTATITHSFDIREVGAASAADTTGGTDGR